jgi:hypothetical protein
MNDKIQKAAARIEDDECENQHSGFPEPKQKPGGSNEASCELNMERRIKGRKGLV